MKFNYFLAILATASLFASCVKEPIPADGGLLSEDEKGYADYDDDSVFRGWVRIKLAEDAQPLKVGEFTRGMAETGNPQLDEIATRLGATEVRRVFADGGRFAARRRKFGLHLWYDIKLGEDVPVSRAEASIGALPGVAHVQPIYRRKFINDVIVPAELVYVPPTASIRQPMAASDLPFDDPGLPKQWHYNNDGSMENSTAGADINLFKGWELLGTKGSPDVIVAVMDSGVQWDHPDLADNMWFNEVEINGEDGVDDDNNGYYDDKYGACFMPNWFPHNKPGGVMRPGTHGTHVAGTIAAVNGNGIGVCGIAGGTGNKDGVKIMTLQLMRDDAPGDDLPMDDIFAYAADNGAVIASCSWTISQTGMGEDTRIGIDYFNANAGMDDTDGDGENDVQVGPMAGGLCIFGAGNSGTNNVFYPAKDPTVVGVGAIEANGRVAWYSEYGEGIDVMAPGGNDRVVKELAVYSTYTNGGYAYSAGTSMATPHVSGIAALLLSKFQGQGFTAAELRSMLERSCRPVGADMDPKYHGGVGNGVLDMSLLLTQRPEEGPQKPAFEAVAAPASVRISGPVPVDGNGMPVAKYNFEYTEVVNGTAGETTRTMLSNTSDAGKEFVYVFPGNSESHYKFRINAVDRYGNESEYIDLESPTLIFENHAPVLLREFSDVEIKRAGEDNSRLYTLLSYFSEPDAQYGDELSFDFRNSDERIVRVELRQGRTLIITPFAKGSCVVTAIASDTRGAVTEAEINVTVLEGPSPDGIEITRPLGSLSLPSGGSFSRDYDLLSYFTVPEANRTSAGLSFSASSSDPGVVAAAIAEGHILRVSGLAKGSAEITVVAEGSTGSVSDVLAVTVGENPSVGASGAMSLYPNPVEDHVNIRVQGAASAQANVAFYDSAARRVVSADVQLDANGVARVDQVAGLAPGSYMVMVRVGSETYRGTILKR